MGRRPAGGEMGTSVIVSTIKINLKGKQTKTIIQIIKQLSVKTMYNLDI